MVTAMPILTSYWGFREYQKMAFLDPPSTRPKQSQHVISKADNQVVDCCKLSVLNYSNVFSAVDALVYALFEPQRPPLCRDKMSEPLSKAWREVFEEANVFLKLHHIEFHVWVFVSLNQMYVSSALSTKHTGTLASGV